MLAILDWGCLEILQLHSGQLHPIWSRANRANLRIALEYSHGKDNDKANTQASRLPGGACALSGWSCVGAVDDLAGEESGLSSVL
jgi:hypothetical protein